MQIYKQFLRDEIKDIPRIRTQKLRYTFTNIYSHIPHETFLEPNYTDHSCGQNHTAQMTRSHPILQEKISIGPLKNRGC